MPQKQIRSEKKKKLLKQQKKIRLFVNCLECANNGVLNTNECLKIATIMRDRNVSYQNAVKIDNEIDAKRRAQSARRRMIYYAEERADNAASTQANNS